MRTIGRITTVAWLLGLGACGGGTGGVEGLVIERQREIAVEAALVTVKSQEGKGDDQFTFTDINGRYAFEDVPEGLNEVRIIKEGYATSPLSCGADARTYCKLADVVEGAMLTLDFVSLQFIGRQLIPTFQIQIVDERGPLGGATVDFYRGPCIGADSSCFRNLPGPPVYQFNGSFVTDAGGIVTVPQVAVGGALVEFNEYMFQLRVAAPAHRNSLFDFSVSIDSIPPLLQFVLPQL